MVPGCRDDDQSEDCHLRLQWEGRTFPCLWYSGGVKLNICKKKNAAILIS